jgi:hypothetical protein
MEQERQIYILEAAIEKLNEAYELIHSVVGDDGRVDAYLLRGLDHMAHDNGNPYDISVPKLIEEIKEDPEKYNFPDNEHNGIL